MERSALQSGFCGVEYAEVVLAVQSTLQAIQAPELLDNSSGARSDQFIMQPFPEIFPAFCLSSLCAAHAILIKTYLGYRVLIKLATRQEVQ